MASFATPSPGLPPGVLRGNRGDYDKNNMEEGGISSHHHQQRSFSSSLLTTSSSRCAANTTTELVDPIEGGGDVKAERRDRSSTEDIFFITPPMNSPSRRGTKSSSVVNLVATMIGGGVLSLPYAISRGGVVAGTLFLLLSSILSAFSLGLLISCARRTGAQSYQDVAAAAFGATASRITLVLLALLTFLATVGYMILIRDLATPITTEYIWDFSNATKADQRWYDDAVAAICLAPFIPLCFARTLNSLRFASFASLMALLVLAVAIFYKCIERRHAVPIDPNKITYFPKSFGDALYAFPFMQVAFMCHFNILPTHTSLVRPTRKRLNHVVDATIGFACLFYLLVAHSGYMYAYDLDVGVSDNILNNFSNGDILINIGRAGLLMSLLLSIPLLILPCRDSILKLWKEFASPSERAMSTSARDRLLPPSRIPSDVSYVSVTPERPPSTRAHITVTCLIILATFSLMVLVPDIATVWNLTGSTVSIILGFIMPSAFYLKLTRESMWTSRRKQTMCLLVFSCIVFVCCTIESVYSAATGDHSS